MHIQSLTDQWQFRQVGTAEWLPATVPGGVHTDLLALGRLPDPFVGDNEKRVQWVAESDWEYRHTFTIDSSLLNEDHVWLVCDGLDTLATITLNGHELGHTNNMFRQYRWDVKAFLRPIDNELLIGFDSPVQYITEKQQVRVMPGVSQAIPGGPYLRKAPCHFGWDWGPQLPPIGIWKSLRLEGHSSARLDDVHVRQVHQNGSVTVETQITIERWTAAAVIAEVRVTAPDGATRLESVSFATDTASITISIDQPQLWWPNGYGDQPLYQVEVIILRNDDILDRRSYTIGLRTIELRQQEDQWGRSFVFVVNGGFIPHAHYGRTLRRVDPIGRGHTS